MSVSFPRTAERQLSVLVVDDEPGIRETVAALLEDEGYSVSLARDGLEALAAVEGQAFDLVLSDVKMPKLDGLSLARWLRRDGYDRPIVLMSAVFTGVDHAGMTIVPKPFDFSVLLDRVEEAIATHGTGDVAIG